MCKHTAILHTHPSGVFVLSNASGMPLNAPGVPVNVFCALLSTSNTPVPVSSATFNTSGVLNHVWNAY